MGIMIGDKNYWGQDIGTETIKLIIKWAFKKLDINELKLGVRPNNIAAINAYKKAGFELMITNKVFDYKLMNIRRK